MEGSCDIVSGSGGFLLDSGIPRSGGIDLVGQVPRIQRTRTIGEFVSEFIYIYINQMCPFRKDIVGLFKGFCIE